MPPHCDTKDGPVVAAATLALEKNNVNLVLPWAPEEAESEIRSAFTKASAARKLGAKEIADTWFFETVVRLHRAGEGAPYTGLKPAGLDEGPVVPKVEEAIEKRDPAELIGFLNAAVEDEVRERFEHVMHTKNYNPDNVKAARRFVQQFLGLTLYSHHLYQSIRAGQKDHH